MFLAETKYTEMFAHGMHSLVNWSNCSYNVPEFLTYKQNILNLFKGHRYNHDLSSINRGFLHFLVIIIKFLFIMQIKNKNNAFELNIHAQKHLKFQMYSTHPANKCSSLCQRTSFSLNYLWFLIPTLVT